MLKLSSLSSRLKGRSSRYQASIVRESGLFDETWYLKQYPDVEASGIDPILHYFKFGAAEGRWPTPDFDTLWYLEQNDDVRNSGINPFLHFIQYGKSEERPTKAAPTAQQKKVTKTVVGDLSVKLWGGFSQYALAELEAFVQDKSHASKERTQALYTLARWYASNGDWARVTEAIKQIRLIDIKFYRAKRTKLLLVESLIQQELYDKAKDFIEPSLEYNFDSDLICALSNIDSGDESRLATLNRIYEHYGLATLSFLQPALGMKFGNLDVQSSLTRISDGPKISILVPVYKAEEFISVAINSLLAQTWSNIEVIAVDDCSPDNSFSILQDIAQSDTRLKIFQNEENLGAYGTRNKALSLATGDFITVHDSDDWSHPQMLEIQMGAMMSDPRLKVTCSMMARVMPDMRLLLRPQRNNLDYVHRSYPSVLIRRRDLNALGEWDGVSANADDEFVQRARILWGNNSVKDILTGVPLSFFLVHENSLTQNKKTSLNSLTFGIRQEYSRQAKYWKENKISKDADTIVTQRSSLKEPFPIPAGLAPNNWPINKDYDLVIISDLSLLGGTRRCNEGYIRAALSAGLRVGLFHWPRYDLKIAEIAKEYTELTYHNNVDMLVHEDEVSANLVIIHHPPILKYELDAVPKLDCRKLAILVNQSPMQLRSEQPHYYDESEVNKQCLRLFNQLPIWIAISSVVEETLKLAGGGKRLHNEIWYPPFSGELPDTKPSLAPDFGTDTRPIVIGRHSRDHWTKWPSSAKGIKDAYCANRKGIEVRILGGAKTPRKLMSRIPDNWKVCEFDTVEVQEFISGLDFFLHFTHADYIEEFGRNIMEAMAAGKVAILPSDYKTVFGDAAVYCEEKHVERTVLEYWADKEMYQAQAERGFNFVKLNCSKQVVERKLKSVLDV